MHVSIECRWTFVGLWLGALDFLSNRDHFPGTECANLGRVFRFCHSRGHSVDDIGRRPLHIFLFSDVLDVKGNSPTNIKLLPYSTGTSNNNNKTNIRGGGHHFIFFSATWRDLFWI